MMMATKPTVLLLRWYAENFNSTEFGLYYQKADSRLPYISYNTRQQTITGNAVGWNASAVGVALALQVLLGAIGCRFCGPLTIPKYATIGLNDPHGLMALLRSGNCACWSTGKG